MPARVAVYFVLALTLFPDASYGRVWDTLWAACCARVTRTDTLSRRQRRLIC
ncbi:hypothetical protein GCM10023080_096940 [Streptomyces pseudoechinosporeus]